MHPSVSGMTHPRCKKRYALDGLFACFEYKSVVKKLIYKYKYKPYISDLKTPIGTLMVEGLNENELFFSILKDSPLFIPVPLSVKRERERGYNQSALIAQYVAQYFHKEYVDILERTKNTQPQYLLKKEQRKVNVFGAFKILDKHRKLINGRTIVVVDDIATSCSTLAECAKVLKKNGAKEVWGVVFAREG